MANCVAQQLVGLLAGVYSWKFACSALAYATRKEYMQAHEQEWLEVSCCVIVT